jgi:hypothetical protein
MWVLPLDADIKGLFDNTVATESVKSGLHTCALIWAGCAIQVVTVEHRSLVADTLDGIIPSTMIVVANSGT